MFCIPPQPLMRLRLAPGVACHIANGKAEMVIGGQTALASDDGPSLRLLAAVQDGGVPQGDTAQLAAAERQWLSAGVLCVEFLAAAEGPAMARLYATGYAQVLRADEPPPGCRLRKGAVLWAEAEGWRLGHPLSRFELWLARASLLDELQAEVGAHAHLVRALWAAGLCEAEGHSAPQAPGWSAEDQLFHAASRRHADHRARGKRPSRPDWAPPRPPVLPSAPADPALRHRLQAVPFDRVLASRRSVRGALPAPSRDDLLALLNAAQAERGDQPTAPCRAYPMAGGLQALDFHLVMPADADGPAHLYRHDAFAGCLLPVAAPAGSAQRLLEEAGQAWGMNHGLPSALIVVTARLAELGARYEATAYRLALLEAGGVLLLLNQLATALGLGACVLGNGDSELFALASGLPESEAPAIAEIAIAGRLG